MWAADFDESLAGNLEENCLEALIVHLPTQSGLETREEKTENGGDIKGGFQPKPGNGEGFVSENMEMKSVSAYPFCGLTRNFWSRSSSSLQNCTVVTSSGNVNEDLPVFCVAAILITNRQKILKETHSIDDMIKVCTCVCESMHFHS